MVCILKFSKGHKSKLGWSQMLTDGWTNGRKTRSLYRAMPEAGATKNVEFKLYHIENSKTRVQIV